MKDYGIGMTVVKWAKNNTRIFPWRYRKKTAYEIFIAEMLLKRTTAKAASTLYGTIIKKYPTLEKLVHAKESDLSKLVKPIGYPQRAKEMTKVAKSVKNEFGGKFPKEKERLMSIPFIGDYTANAILSLAFNEPFPMIDSNVNRIVTRLFLGTDSPKHITKPNRELVAQILPRRYHREFNFAMIDIGGTICTPRKPKCPVCPLKGVCKFYKTKIS